MKTFAVLAATAVASTSALEVSVVNPTALRGADLAEVDLSQYHVRHGQLDDQHCEELFIPLTSYKQFMSTDGWKYPTYTDGMCEAPYTTYDAKKSDSDFPEVVHVKRGLGSTDATVTTTACDGTSFTYSVGPAVKGSTVKITASGSVSGVTGGSYSASASFGSISLVDQTANQGQDMSKSITVLFTNFGTFSTSMFSVPASGDVSFSMDVPVPNIDGTVTGKTVGKDQDGNELWCMNFNMAL